MKLNLRNIFYLIRVCYVDFEIRETIYLLAVFAKNELENLTKEERNELKKIN